MDWQQIIKGFEQEDITGEMNHKGYAYIPKVVTNEECDELKAQFINEILYRKTIQMERYRFGLGEYKYYNYPLPALVQKLREDIYPLIAPIANHWMSVLNTGKQFPGSLNELTALCHQHNQTRPTPLILKYGKGGYNALHQDLYGHLFFPIQLVVFLNDPDTDYKGGEFVLIEQRPRAQSKAIVLKPRKGDILLFTTNYRPVKGSKGYYRVNMKHGVSELLHGERYTLGIIFHDAA